MRDQGVEILRFVAASFIVYWHVPLLTSGPCITWSLPAFVAISVLYGRKQEHIALGTYVRRLVQRLFVPWILWSVVYVAVRSANHYEDLRDWASTFAWTDLLIGGVLPLWYLPFIFGVLAIDAVFRSTLQHWVSHEAADWFLAAAFLMLGVLSLVYWRELRGGALPFPQYGSVLPATLLLLSLTAMPATASWAARLFAIVVMGVVALWFDFGWIPTALGLGTVMLLHGRWEGANRTVLWLGRLSWPMYLVHPLFIAVAMRVSDSGLLVFAIVFLVSAIVSDAVLRHDRLAALLLEGRVRIGKLVA